ncbi:hypothetical protein BGZ51_006334 [Haplosporangium sp. Z 767]|nr:hypothetical protein BGZ51_006334 [Haplosporangium sp. Z 767]
MKPQIQSKKPLQSRHRANANAASARKQAAAGSSSAPAPAVPRMLRRMTKQSFMDVDLQYLMKLDPTTTDPFENSSPVFDDPPSLFRPIPASHTQGGSPGSSQWMSTETLRLQKEQEDLRVQYLQFLHQLHQTNPHGFLVHMNTFAAEFPQEFAQLQAYIRFQEQLSQQQREEALRQEQMRQYQLQLEQRRQQEQELQRFQQFQEMQYQQSQIQEMQQLLQEWLLRRHQKRATSFRLHSNNKDDGLDLADVFTIALQKDPKMIEKMIMNHATGVGGGLELLLTPAQQQEFAEFWEQRKIQDMLTQEKKKQDLAAAGLSSLVFNPSMASPSSTVSSSLWPSSLLNSSTDMSPFNFAAAAAATTGQMAFQSQYKPSMTQEQYLKRNRGGNRRP